MENINKTLFSQCKSTICSLTITPNGSLLIGGSEDGIIRIWNLSHRYYTSLPGHITLITNVACSNNFFASNDDGGTLYLWPLPEKLTLCQIFFLYMLKNFRIKKLEFLKEQFLNCPIVQTFKPLIRNHIIELIS